MYQSLQPKSNAPKVQLCKQQDSYVEPDLQFGRYLQLFEKLIGPGRIAFIFEQARDTGTPCCDHACN